MHKHIMCLALYNDHAVTRALFKHNREWFGEFCNEVKESFLDRERQGIFMPYYGWRY